MDDEKSEMIYSYIAVSLGSNLCLLGHGSLMVWYKGGGGGSSELGIFSRAFRETIRMTFGVCVCVCVCVRACVRTCVRVQGISPSITGRILMKLRMNIPVHHAQCV